MPFGSSVIEPFVTLVVILLLLTSKGPPSCGVKSSTISAIKSPVVTGVNVKTPVALLYDNDEVSAPAAVVTLISSSSILSLFRLVKFASPSAIESGLPLPLRVTIVAIYISSIA